jgi:hypothetical protein
MSWVLKILAALGIGGFFMSAFPSFQTNWIDFVSGVEK